MSKLTVAVTACIFAVAFGASQTSVRAASSDEASIRALENRYVAAVNAKDVSAVMKVYVPDEKSFRVRRAPTTSICWCQGLRQRLDRRI
jgi:hypothetical protein